MSRRQFPKSTNVTVDRFEGVDNRLYREAWETASRHSQALLRGKCKRNQQREYIFVWTNPIITSRTTEKRMRQWRYK